MQLYSSDYLKVYRGFPGSSNYGEIASYNGSINHWYDDTYQWNYVESDHESGALTFYFYSNSNTEWAGWEGIITSEGSEKEEIFWDVVYLIHNKSSLELFRRQAMFQREIQLIAE